MGCCLAVAFLMSLVRRVWLTIVPQSPAESALFATPAVRMGPSPADRPLPQVVRAESRQRVAKPRILAATLLAYVATVQALVWLDVMIDAGRPWLTRDIILALILAVLLIRPAGSLISAGLLWFALGVADMHLFGVIALPHSRWLIDVVFHASGIWVATAGVALLAWRKRATLRPVTGRQVLV